MYNDEEGYYGFQPANEFATPIEVAGEIANSERRVIEALAPSLNQINTALQMQQQQALAQQYEEAQRQQHELAREVDERMAGLYGDRWTLDKGKVASFINENPHLLPDSYSPDEMTRNLNTAYRLAEVHEQERQAELAQAVSREKAARLRAAYQGETSYKSYRANGGRI